MQRRILPSVIPFGLDSTEESGGLSGEHRADDHMDLAAARARLHIGLMISGGRSTIGSEGGEMGGRFWEADER